MREPSGGGTVRGITGRRGERVALIAGLGSDDLVTAGVASMPWNGPRRLMAAVLADALGVLGTTTRVVEAPRALERPTGRGRRKGNPVPVMLAAKAAALRAETLAWFQSEWDGPFSFVGICQAVGLDPDVLRAHLAKTDWQGIARMHRSALLHTRDTLATTKA